MNTVVTVPSVGITLDRFILRKQKAFPSATGDLSQVLRDIALAGKIISREINRFGLADLTGDTATDNVQGEMQQKLDWIAHVRFIRALVNGGEVCGIISEEEAGIIDTGNPEGKYVIAMDPLDGSSNIDANVAIGTIFSVYRRVSPLGTSPTVEDFLQGGRQQVAAGYILYGSSTMLVYSTGCGVDGFTYEPTLGEYILSHPDLTFPVSSKTFSCNESNQRDFPPFVIQRIQEFYDQRFSSRYIGSFVADFHRNLIKGGIYLYPPTQTHIQGKLRLIYECYPMAFLAEQAGGKAIDGQQPILDITPTCFHQRTPLYIGSPALVDYFEIPS
ncbi:class 1 fructose-bisphosphatase [Siphonobacter sp.]|uniref:class 1 fructose-bisphosphatase n=1 Tax=Siphonobacter sp. TaxID=1869184 RepID=UPI003B3A3F04